MNRIIRLILLLLCILPAAFAQQTRQINGQVKEGATGDILPGVSVVLKGTTTGTTTDANGKYTLSIPDRSDVKLSFSFIGYASQEVSVSNRSVVDVTLATDEKNAERGRCYWL